MKPLVNRKENIYFVLLLLSSITMYLVLFISVIGIPILAILVLLPILAHLIFTAQIRTNGVRVTEKQFPEIHERAREVAKEMGFYQLPDIFVMESGGLLNAFATRFFGRNMIVLFADLFEMKDSDPKVVDFVIAHELAHIRRNHLIKSTVLLPGNWIPFLGSAYSRACEYTCDQMASHYINDFEASTRALTMLAVGRKYYNTIDQHEYMLHSSREKGVFIWLSEKLMSHPTLPKRIAALYKFNDIENPIVFKTSKRVIGVGVFLVGFSIGISALTVFYADKLVNYVESSFSEFLDSGETPLTVAVMENDIETVQQLIDDGEEINTANEYGETPIFATTYIDENEINKEMLTLLLENGADPALGDVDGVTILQEAVAVSDKKAVDLLLQYDADINQQDGYGETPIFGTIDNDDADMFQYLVNKGANIMIQNAEGKTIKEVAEENSAVEILKVLNKAKRI